jgi:hypothetical protein
MPAKKKTAAKKRTATRKATNPPMVTFGKFINASSVRLRKVGRRIVMDVKR